MTTFIRNHPGFATRIQTAIIGAVLAAYAVVFIFHGVANGAI